MMITKRQKQNSRKEATEMKWFKVTMKYFDGKAIKCTDVLQVESVEAVYAYYETNVDMYCHILKVTEITPKKAQRLLKKMYSIEF